MEIKKYPEQGKKLIEYLNHLGKETEKMISKTNEKSFRYLMHSQLKEIVNSEKEFLNQVYSGVEGIKPMLAISPNGLPSADSLRADLESMCGLAKEHEEFKNIRGRYAREINGKNNGDKDHLYVPVSEEDWNKEFQNRETEKLSSQIGFSVNETEDRKLELSVREEIYLQGYDKYSKEFPVLVREGKTKYHVVWNNLLEESEESFYVPNTGLILKGKRSIKKIP